MNQAIGLEPEYSRHVHRRPVNLDDGVIWPFAFILEGY